MVDFCFLLMTLALCVVSGFNAKRAVSLYLALGMFFFVAGGLVLVSRGAHWPAIISLALGALGAVGIAYMSWEESRCAHD